RQARQLPVMDDERRLRRHRLSVQTPLRDLEALREREADVRTGGRCFVLDQLVDAPVALLERQPVEATITGWRPNQSLVARHDLTGRIADRETGRAERVLRDGGGEKLVEKRLGAARRHLPEQMSPHRRLRRLIAKHRGDCGGRPLPQGYLTLRAGSVRRRRGCRPGPPEPPSPRPPP